MNYMARIKEEFPEMLVIDGYQGGIVAIIPRDVEEIRHVEFPIGDEVMLKTSIEALEDDIELQKKEGKKVHQELHFYRAYSVEEPPGELGRINYFIVK